MTLRPVVLAVAFGLLGVLVLAPYALAQSSSPATAAASETLESFTRLAPHSQKIARALFDAQNGAPKLTLHEIATLRLAGTTWGEIFADFLARDLVTEKQLNQLMRQYKTELTQSGRNNN
jgi:hypothetical protein